MVVNFHMWQCLFCCLTRNGVRDHQGNFWPRPHGPAHGPGPMVRPMAPSPWSWPHMHMVRPMAPAPWSSPWPRPHAPAHGGPWPLPHGPAHGPAHGPGPMVRPMAPAPWSGPWSGPMVRLQGLAPWSGYRVWPHGLAHGSCPIGFLFRPWALGPWAFYMRVLIDYPIPPV